MDDRVVFDRGKQILGKQAGGLIAKLLRAKGGKIDLTLEALEMAATKNDPREYVGAMLKGEVLLKTPKGKRGVDWW